MAIYQSKSAISSIATVEFTPVSDGNLAFFAIKSVEQKEEAKQWLASQAIGQEIVGEALVGGKPMLVTHGDKTKENLLKVLEEHGDTMAPKVVEKKMDMWKWRGTLSMIGHPMQLASSFMGPKGFDFGVGLFASLNLLANFSNFIFGAERKVDNNRLKHIKQEINDDLGEHITLQNLIDVDDTRASARTEPGPPPTMLQKFSSFMRRNSVMVGEIGLRYLGGVSLVFPINQWKATAKAIAESQPLEKIWLEARNKDKFIALAGSGWLAGKTIAFFSKVPDPYSDKPHTWVDTIREKVLFRASSVLEMAGAGTLAWHRFNKGKIQWPDKGFIPQALRGKKTTDYLGSVGGVLFMAAFAIRAFAPFGVREVNMEEVYAHSADTLARTPPDKLPQLLAETAATVKDHFKDKDMEYGEIYSQMMNDLYRYHHIALDNLGTEPQERTAKLQQQAAAFQVDDKGAISSAPNAAIEADQKRHFAEFNANEFAKNAEVSLGAATQAQQAPEHKSTPADHIAKGPVTAEGWREAANRQQAEKQQKTAAMSVPA